MATTRIYLLSPLHRKRNSLCLHQGVVSPTLHDLYKIILLKYTMPEITFFVRISSWNFVRVSKAMLEMLISTIFAMHKLRENILEKSGNVSETTPADSYMLWWMINKVDPKLRCISRAKSLIKSCVSHKYVAFYELACHIVTIKGLLPIFSARLRWTQR